MPADSSRRVQQVRRGAVVAGLEPAVAEDRVASLRHVVDAVREADLGRERVEVPVAARDELRAAVEHVVAVALAPHASARPSPRARRPRLREPALCSRQAAVRPAIPAPTIAMRRRRGQAVAPGADFVQRARQRSSARTASRRTAPPQPWRISRVSASSVRPADEHDRHARLRDAQLAEQRHAARRRERQVQDRGGDAPGGVPEPRERRVPVRRGEHPVAGAGDDALHQARAAPARRPRPGPSAAPATSGIRAKVPDASGGPDGPGADVRSPLTRGAKKRRK